MSSHSSWLHCHAQHPQARLERTSFICRLRGVWDWWGGDVGHAGPAWASQDSQRRVPGSETADQCGSGRVRGSQPDLANDFSWECLSPDETWRQVSNSSELLQTHCIQRSTATYQNAQSFEKAWQKTYSCLLVTEDKSIDGADRWQILYQPQHIVSLDGPGILSYWVSLQLTSGMH